MRFTGIKQASTASTFDSCMMAGALLNIIELVAFWTKR
jgi:hypothetical protein